MHATSSTYTSPETPTCEVPSNGAVEIGLLPVCTGETSICYRRHEAAKKRAYEQRIREVEHSSFTPLVFSASGGMGQQGSTFYRRLAALLTEKWNESYSSTLSWIRCLLSFCLLRSAIQCIRGARSSRGHAINSSLPIDLVSHEAKIG